MGKTKILVVDDSPFQRVLLKDALTEHGFEVIGEAGSLEEVIEEVKRERPDAVTMDMTIPGTDGFECTREIHKIDKTIKVIVVSAMMDDELIIQANKAFGLRVVPPMVLNGQLIQIARGNLQTEYSATFESEFGDIKINIGFGRGEVKWM